MPKLAKVDMIIEKIKKMNLESHHIVKITKILSDGKMTHDTRVVRAAMLEVYEQRHGEEKCNELMDKIGM